MASTSLMKSCTGPALRALAGKVRYVIDPVNPYPRQFTGHVRATLKDGSVREARQDHFRGGVHDPMSLAALEERFRANCAYGGWSGEQTDAALVVLRGLRDAPKIDLSHLRG